MEAARAIARNAAPQGKAWLAEWDENFVEELYNPEYLLREMINRETGARHHFTLGHIVSGAMIEGLIARAKSRAFRRDIKHSTMSGVTLEDLREAIKDVYVENKELNHDYALREFVTEVALPAEQAKEALSNRRMN
jgi:SpoVK/Ycf46/Vps4 family AAA+-type ATPase